MFRKPINEELNAQVEKQLAELEELTEEIELKAENAALFEAQLIGYMVENQISELTIGDTVVTLDFDEALDIDKMKEDGIYEDFLLKVEDK